MSASGILVIDARDRLVFLMVRCYPRSHQSERKGQALVHVYLDLQTCLFQQMVYRIKPCRPGTDDGDPQRVRFATDERHVIGVRLRAGFLRASPSCSCT